MGNVPRFIGKLTDLALGTEVRVVDKVNLPYDLVLVTFVSPILIGKSIRALSKIELHLGDGHLRSYTPANIDSVSGSVSVCFHNHKQGEEERYVINLIIIHHTSSWIIPLYLMMTHHHHHYHHSQHHHH